MRNIKVRITGNRENRRHQGLEVPCKVIIKTPHHAFVKADVIIRDLCSKVNDLDGEMNYKQDFFYMKF